MVKRNLQLQQESYKMMVGKKLVEKIGDSKVAVNSNNFTKLLGKGQNIFLPKIRIIRSYLKSKSMLS